MARVAARKLRPVLNHCELSSRLGAKVSSADHDGEHALRHRLAIRPLVGDREGQIEGTVGLGDPAGARIPIVEGGRRKFIEHDGQIVMSRLGEEVLQQIAVHTGGTFVPARTRLFSLDDIYHQKIAVKEGRETEQTKQERFTNRYQWFLLVGFLLLWSTSYGFAHRRMGGAAWKRLQRGVYVVLALAVLHVGHCGKPLCWLAWLQGRQSMDCDRGSPLPPLSLVLFCGWVLVLVIRLLEPLWRRQCQAEDR